MKWIRLDLNSTASVARQIDEVIEIFKTLSMLLNIEKQKQNSASISTRYESKSNDGALAPSSMPQNSSGLTKEKAYRLLKSSIEKRISELEQFYYENDLG